MTGHSEDAEALQVLVGYRFRNMSRFQSQVCHQTTGQVAPDLGNEVSGFAGKLPQLAAATQWQLWGMSVGCDLSQPGASYVLNTLWVNETGQGCENCGPLILGVNKWVFLGCGVSMSVATRQSSPLGQCKLIPGTQ